jgi:exonuclease SbcC
MIKTVEVINFQSHEETFIEFSPGVNIIKGSSHTGKSAFLRAMKWALTSKPRGIDFRSWFAKDNNETAVAITFSEGSFVDRVYDGKKHSYEYNSGDFDTQKIEAMRSDLPEEIQAITKLQDINLRFQHDNYYLLQDSSGAVNRQLNDLVGLGKIHEISKRLNAKIKETKIIYDNETKKIKQAEEEIKKLKWLDKAEKEFKALAKLNTKLSEKQNYLEKLEQISNQLSVVDMDIKDTEDWLEIEPEAIQLKADIEELIDLKFTLNNLSSWQDLTDQLELEVDRVSKLIKAEIHLNELINEQKQLDELNIQFQNLSGLYASIGRVEKSSLRATQTLSEANTALTTLTKKLGVCPLCNQPFKVQK